ncbi:MAG: heme biosynthesis protein HemY [Rubricella sp.]
MLTTLIKIAVFLGLVTAAAFGVLYVMDNGGGMSVSFGGREFAFTSVEVLILLGLLFLAFWLALLAIGFTIALIRFLTGDETAISRFFDRSRERRGFAALADSMMALASGDGKTAVTKARKAETLLDRPELTRLINAQASELAGRPDEAEAYYKKMLGDSRTRFVGVHGLMRQRLQKGDTETALKLAEKAFALKPRHDGLLDTLFALQTENHDWSKAKTRELSRDVTQRRDAILSYADAEAALRNSDTEEARARALEANRLAPTLVPAAVLAARLHVESGSPRAANRVITKAWKAAPHPDLAAAFAAVKPDETPEARRKRFEPLLALHPDHAETKMIAAELALAAEDFPAARKALGSLATDEPTTRSIAIMAAIERGEGASDAVVRGWLARAITAPRGPEWICDNCGKAHGHWQPVCDSCGAFDTLDWHARSESADAADGAAAMLPLVVGMLQQDTAENGPDAGADDAETIDTAAADDTAPDIVEDATEPASDGNKATA